VFENLSGVREPPMIVPMTTTGHHQRYDHRLQDLAQRTGDVTIATDLGFPRYRANVNDFARMRYWRASASS
jgi:hypothetical protein